MTRCLDLKVILYRRIFIVTEDIEVSALRVELLQQSMAGCTHLDGDCSVLR